jgi:hypothetical protein
MLSNLYSYFSGSKDSDEVDGGSTMISNARHFQRSQKSLVSLR